MDPMWIMTLMGIAGLLLLAAIFLVPVYLGFWASLYWIYDKKGEAQKILAIKFDTSKVIEHYQQFFAYWQQYQGEDAFERYMLPLFVPPAIGILAGIGFTYAFVKFVRSQFTVDD